MASTMQLEFSQAMNDFKTMFPDMDHDVIEAVLRANQGAVDATIDQLLAMSTDNQNEKLRNELDKPASGTLINIGTDEADVKLVDTSEPPKPLLLSTSPQNVKLPVLAATTGASPKIKKSSEPNSSTALQPPQREGQSRWNPPLLGTLPPGFLRIANPECSRPDYDLPDEQFALMLQNEEFMNELRWNQEFMTALEKEQQGKSRTEDDAAFKERLKTMGKISRKKFLQVAKVFTWQRNKKTTSAKQIDSLPLKEEPSDDEDHIQVKK